MSYFRNSKENKYNLWAQLFLGLFWWLRHQICREIWEDKDVMDTIDSDRGGYMW